MSEDEQLEQLINQTLDGSLATIPAHLQEIEQNKHIVQTENPKEFVFGLIVGAALTTGITGIVQIKKKHAYCRRPDKNQRHGLQKNPSN